METSHCHRRLLRDGDHDVRLRVCAELASRVGAARVWMDGARQPRAIARYAAGGMRRAGTDGSRVRIRARDGHPWRRAWTAVRHSVAGLGGPARRSSLDTSARLGRGAGLRAAGAGEQENRGTKRTGTFGNDRVEVRTASQELLA